MSTTQPGVRVKLSADATQLKTELQGAADATVAASNRMQAATRNASVAAEMSAKQTAAALRGVPAQFTDIATSLASGQAPLTVFLQQGGQLKDMFGGAGAAARALGGYVVGLVNPFTVAAGAAGALYLAHEQGRKESAMLEAALVSSGNAIGVTTGQLNAMALALEADGFSRGAAAGALATIASESKVAKEDLQAFTATALDMERYAGVAVDKTAKAFADLANEPAKATLKLSESLYHLTQAQYEHIKSLEDAGRKTDAVRLAQQAYSDALKPIADNARANLGYLEVSWNAVGKSAAWAWNQMLNVGRQETGEDRLAAAREKLEKMRTRGGAFGQSATERQAMIQAAQAEVTYLERVTHAMKENAAAEGERKRAQEAGVAATVAVERVNERSLTKQQQMTKALEEYRRNIENIRKANPESVLLNPDKIAAGEAAIREQYKTTAAVVSTAGALELANLKGKVSAAQAYLGQLKQQQPEAAKLNEGQTLALQLEQQLAGKLDAKARAVKEQTLAQARLLGLVQAETAEVERQEKARDKARQQAEDEYQRTQQELADAEVANSKAREQGRQAVQDYGRGIDELNAASELEISLMGKSAKERKIALEHYRIELDLKKQIDAIDRNTGFNKADRQEQYALARANAERAKAGAAVRAEADEHIKMWESIDQTAQDVFVNVFEDGAGTFKRLGQTLKAALLDWLYQMTVKKWIVNIQGQFSGGGTAAQAQGGGAGGGGLSFGGLDTWGGAALQAYGGYTAGASAASLGYANAVGAMGGDAMGALIAGNGGWAGVGAGSGFMSSIAAAAPYIAAFVAVAALAKKFKSPGEQHTGGFYSSSGATGMDAALGITGGNDAWARDLIKRANPEIGNLVKTTVGSVISATQANAKALGMDIALGIDAGFASNTNGQGKDKNNFGYFDITINGETVAEYMNRTLGEDLPAAVTQWTTDMADAAAQWVLGGEAAWKALAHQGETASATLDRVVLSLTSVNSMFDMLGHQIKLTGMEGATAAAKFADLFGGLQQAQQAVSAYHNDFFTEAERNAYTTRVLTAALGELGQAMPATRAEFRAMVDSALAAGNLDLAAQLMALAPAVASVIPPMDELTNTLRSAADIAQERAGLERELLQLQGNTAALRTLDLAALDESNHALQRQIWALQDQKAAQEAAAQAAQQAAQAHQQYVNALASAGGTIASLIRDLKATMGGTADPMSVMRQRQADYLADLARARSGDVEASQRVAQSARAYLDAAQVVSGNDRQAATVAQVVSELQSLPAVQTFEQQQLGLLRELAANTWATQSAVTLAQQAIIDTLSQQTTRLAGSISTDFSTFDANGDGLTLAELQTALAGKATDQQIVSLRNLIDTDNDGIISRLEAQTAASNTFGAQVAASLGGRFDALTATTGGLLKFDQFKTQFAGLASDATLQSIFTELDANGDGVINKLEALRVSLHSRLGEIIAFGQVVKFDANDPLQSIFRNISQTNDILIQQFKKWLEYIGGVTVAYDKAAGTLTTSAVSGIMTPTNRAAGAAGFPGQYVLQYDSTNYLMNIRDTLDRVVAGSAGFFIKGFGGGGVVPVSGATGGTSGTGGATTVVDTSSILWVIADRISQTNSLLSNDVGHTLRSAALGSYSFKVRGWAANQSLPVTGVGGYAEGGYTGPGGKYDVAGVVHRGEVVWSQADIARWGGVQVVDAMRRGLRGYADGGPVGMPALVGMPLMPPTPRQADGMAVLVGEVRRLNALLARQSAELAEIKASTRSSAVSSAKTADSLSSIQRNGLEVHNNPAEPIYTKGVPA